MLTHYTWCIPLHPKGTDKLCMPTLLTCPQNLADCTKSYESAVLNLRTKSFAFTIGPEQIHSLWFYLQGNKCTENVQNMYVQTCLLTPSMGMNWTISSCAAYNLVSNEHSERGCILPDFGRDACTQLRQMLNPKSDICVMKGASLLWILSRIYMH